MLLYLRDYRAVDIKQCFTKTAKGIKAALTCLGIFAAQLFGKRPMGSSRRQFPCGKHYGFAVTGYVMCSRGACRLKSQPVQNITEWTRHRKKRFLQSAEYLDTTGYAEELEDSYHYISRRQPADSTNAGQFGFGRCEVSIYGMNKLGQVERFSDVMEERFWRCSV